MKKDTLRAVVTMLPRTVWPWPRKDAMTADNTTEEESRDEDAPYRVRNWHGRWGTERIADGWGFCGERKKDARNLCDELNGLARERDAARDWWNILLAVSKKSLDGWESARAERDAAREEAEAMKSRLKWAEDSIAKLEADIAAGSERAVETSPIADGGRYSLMEGETHKVRNEIYSRHATDEDDWFWARAYDHGEAADFCQRLNHERDGRIAAEAELAALKAQHANGSGTPNGSGGDGEELYPVEESGGRWYVRMAPEMWLMAGTEFSAYAFSKTLKELDAARLAAEIRAQVAESNLKVQTDRANALERDLHEERIFSDERKAAQAEAGTLRAKVAEVATFGSRADMHEVERLRSELQDAEETLAQVARLVSERARRDAEGGEADGL